MSTSTTPAADRAKSRDGDDVYFRFESWAHFVEAAAEPTPVEGAASRRREDGGNWSGARTYEDADRLARTGWHEGAERIAPMVATLTEMVRPKRRKLEYASSPVGPGSLSMGRYLMGHPKPYDRRRESSEFEDVAAPRGVLRIVVNMTSSSSVSAEQYFAKGAAACALVDCLETDGFRVELVLYMGSKVIKGVHVYVTIKQADQHLEPDLVAFALANPAAYRRLGFSMWEKAPGDIRANCRISRNGGYGRCNDRRDGEDIYIPAASTIPGTAYGFDPERVGEWVREQLLRQGVEIEDN